MPVDPAKPFDLHFRVGPTHAGMRLDLFVKTMMPSMSRTRIQERIRENRVGVNDVPRPSNWRVQLADRVLIRCRSPNDDPEEAARVPFGIVFEDEHLVLVDKPAGVLVHPVGKHRHDTLLNGLYWKYRDVLPPDAELSLANRLDRDTSGLVLAAKHTEAKRILQGDFEARIPQKEYLAICQGLPSAEAGEIDLPLARAAAGTAMGVARDHCLMIVVAAGLGKESLTKYRVVARYERANCSLVRLQPVTGRQHQLRVHMAALGHPLVCDARYGDGAPLHLCWRDPDTGVEETATVARYALHAEQLTFPHPATRKMLTFQADLATDLARAVELLARGAERGNLS